MKKKPPPADAAPPNNPFAALATLRASLPQGPEARGPGGIPASAGGSASSGGAPAAAPPGPARAVVRLTRKGRGGKEVTVVEQLGLSAAQLDGWLKALKAALGCGGAREGESLALQGDHRPRVKELLEARGVRRVILG